MAREIFLGLGYCVGGAECGKEVMYSGGARREEVEMLV